MRFCLVLLCNLLLGALLSPTGIERNLASASLLLVPKGNDGFAV